MPILVASAAIIVLPIILLVLVLTMPAIIKDQKSKSWPSVAGHVMSSADYRRLGSSGLDPGTDLKLVYEYEVGGVRYTSERLVFGLDGGSLSGRADKYPPGKEITVYFNPAKPEEAVLGPGIGSRNLFRLAAVFVLLPVTAGVFFLLWREYLRRKSLAAIP